MHRKYSVQSSSVSQSCPTLCNPMDSSMSGIPIHHQLPEFIQAHVRWVGDALQPSHPVIPFSSCIQSFPASGSFQISQFFPSSGQRIGVSASASVLSMSIQDWFPLGLTGWISSQSKDSQESSPIPQFKSSVLWCSGFFIVQLSHPYMTIGKTIALTRWTFVDKIMSLLFNILSRLNNFSSKEQGSFKCMATVTICGDFGAQKIKSATTVASVPQPLAMKWWDQMPWS